jgi:hypothetical protein
MHIHEPLHMSLCHCDARAGREPRARAGCLLTLAFHALLPMACCPGQPALRLGWQLKLEASLSKNAF